jgi:DNA-binding IclR family transcriptional regulator
MSLLEQPAAAAVRYRNQATQRVLKVLLAFAANAKPRGVTELSRELGMNKNMIHRALSTLMAENYLVRDASGELCQLGYRLLTLGGGAPSEFDIVALARPALEQLHALTAESVFLSIIVGRNRVTIDDIQAHGPRVLRSVRGYPVALHCTKMSRVLLAHLSDAEVRGYLTVAAPLARPQNFRDPPSETSDGVWQDVAAIRAKPYVLWRNPQNSSAAYAIFPIRDVSGRAHAIITIGGPRERFDLPQIEDQLPRMRNILDPLEREARLFPAPPFVVET